MSFKFLQQSRLNDYLGGAGGLAARPFTNRTALRNFQVGSSSANRHDCRIRHRATASPVRLTAGYAGWQFQAGNAGELPQTPTTRIIDEVWIEFPVGVMSQVKFAGAAGFTLSKWDYVESDPVQWTGAQPQAGDFFYEQISYRQTGSNNFDAPLTTQGALGEYSQLRAFATFGSAASFATGTAGALALGSGAGQSWGAACWYSRNDKPAFVLAGDSIADGAGSGTGGADQGFTSSVEDPGWPGRVLTAAGSPYLRITCPQAGLYAGVNALNCLNLTKGNTKYGLIQLGINDVFSAGSTLSGVQSAYTRAARNLRLAGCRYVFAATLLPATDSTDGWTTLANQTVRLTEAVRLAVNAWLLTNPAIFDGVLDLTPALDPSATDKWPVNGATPVPTQDGTHPGSGMNDRIRAAVQAAFNAMVAAKEALNEGSGGLGTLTNARYPKPTKKTAQVSYTAAASIKSYEYWQNAPNSAAALALVNQVDGSLTGWTLSFSTTTAASLPSNMSTYGNLGEFPDDVFTTIAAFGGTRNITIAGLDPAKTYDLSVLLAYSASGINTNLRTTGAVVSATTLVIAQNNTTPLRYSAIAPDAGGNIVILLNLTQTYAGFNAMSIVEN